MLDTISYSVVNGVVTKTVTSISMVTDVASEIAALQAQLADFQLADISPEIDAAVANYEQQITVLQGA